ncbi:MAG: SH3 domain-containing protein [Clostridium sp.]|nr:SH3 domain-containing protein [Clostridium sp.]
MKRVNVTKVLAGMALFLAVFCGTAISSLAADGKVIAKTANIRAQASADSEVVASTTQGKVIDIQGGVKDGSGTIWYQVPISNGGHGYIRSDLVETSETIKIIEGSSNASQSASSSGPAPEETVPTAIGEQQAVVKSSQNVRVRSGASTKHSALASLPNGTTITLIGEATDNSGNKWYQMTCEHNGRTVEGYVRSDLIEVVEGSSSEGGENPEGEGGENPEGENPEGEEGNSEPEPEPEPEHNDYEIVYTQNDTGEYEYYLYNNIEGNRQKLNELLSAVGMANENNQKLQKQVDNGKIIIIILAALVVVLAIVMIVLVFKIRSLYYDYEDDEEEEEEEEEEPEPVKKKRRKQPEEEEEEEAPARTSVKGKKSASSESAERTSKPGQKESRPRTKSEQGSSQREAAARPAARKPQNFLIDDDEFEFEFLNMDDKDL